MTTPAEKPILFHYPQSIYSHRVLWYLWLRGIPYDESIQPPIMPRPLLSSLSLPYRKIPLLAIGKDIYHDSRLIISKLEQRYPNSTLTPSTPAELGVQKLLENWTVDGGIFTAAVKLMPYWNSDSLLQNKAFLDDRQTLMGGRRMSAESMEKGRPEGLAGLRVAFDMLERTFFADGREWLLGSAGPTLADIDAVWPFEWLVWDRGMDGSLRGGGCGEEEFPRVHAWIRRFMELVEQKKKGCEKPKRLGAEEVTQRLVQAKGEPEALHFEDNNTVGLRKGYTVDVYPSDYGQSGKSTGTLLGLSTNEVVIQNDRNLHLHFPRWNFTIKHSTTMTIPKTINSKPPKMTLLYHPFSPYSRKVYMHAQELNLHTHLTLQKVVVAPIHIPGWSDNTAAVAVYNPMGKIPCLVTEDVPDGLFDSRVICEYLSDLAGQQTQAKKKQDTKYWQLHTLHAAADGIMDAAVLITYEYRIRKERNLYFKEWVEGQRTKITRILDRFENAIQTGVLRVPGSVAAGPDEIAVAVAVALAKGMGEPGIEWSKGRSGLAKWMEVWEKRRSFLDTPPTRDWVENRKISKI